MHPSLIPTSYHQVEQPAGAELIGPRKFLFFRLYPTPIWVPSAPRMQAVFGIIFLSFVARAAIEIPILYLTDWWRCSYGIAHDVATATIAVSLFARARHASRARESNWLFWLIITLLLVEAGFAYAFCSVADPASGTYFASDEARFRTINLVTWAAVTAGYSGFVVLLWRTRGAPASRLGA